MWEEPKEFIEYKRELERLQSASAATSTACVPTPLGNSPFIATISTPVGARGQVGAEARAEAGTEALSRSRSPCA